MATRNYTYYDFTRSLCSACLERVDAKIVFQDDNVFMLKNLKNLFVESVSI